MTIEFGIYVNNRAAVFLEEFYSLNGLLDAAVVAEERGFDFVSVGDSILAKPRYMPIPVLSALATRTSRIKLATGIIQPHMRRPIVFAQDWATLDILSGGRTVLAVGLGTGDPEMVKKEYEVVGIPKRKRGVAFEEAIELVKRLWTEEEVTYDGQIFQYRDVALGYTPAQHPHPPIVIACGGYVPKEPGTGPNDFYSPETAGTFHGPFERVARLGDGWITGIITPEEYARTLRFIRNIAHDRYDRELGAGFHTALNCFINVNTSVEAARSEGVSFLEQYHRRPFDDETVERWLIYGSPERCAERITAYIDAGVTAFQFVIVAHDQIEKIHAIADEVLSLLPAAEASVSAL